jgi:hypothetical protein
MRMLSCDLNEIINLNAHKSDLIAADKALGSLIRDLQKQLRIKVYQDKKVASIYRKIEQKKQDMLAL